MAEELEIPVADNETEQTNDPLGILSPKKQSDNSDPLGILKKKVGGNVSSNGTSNTAPSTSPSISDNQGRIFADNSFFKQIGKQTTPELQQRHDEILSRQKELNTQPKKPSILKKFDSMAAPILGFNRDLVQSINPKKVAEIDHDVNGHWGNIVQNVFAKTEKTVNDIVAGTLGLINDAEQLQNPIKSDATPLGYLIAGLNGNKKRLENVINNNQLPNTFLGNTVSSIASIAPDIAGAALAPEAKIAQGAGVLAKAGGLLFNKFTNYLIGKGIATGYGEAKSEGKTQGEAAIQALKGGAEGAKQGIELAILGAGSGLATKGIMAQAEKAGLTGAKGLATRQLVNLSTDLVAYGLVQPTINAAEEGRFPTMKEIADGAGIAAAFRIKGGVEELRNHTTLNKAIQETQNQRQGVAISNFVDADHDAIKQVYEQPETAQELNIKALEAAKKAKETTDLEKKQQYVAEAITYTKASNVKSVTDAVLNNPKGVEEIQNSDLPDQVKNEFVQKAQEITDLLKTKQEDLESTTVIKPEENIPAETTTIAPKEYTPETKKSGVKVILPKQGESEQQITELPKIEETVNPNETTQTEIQQPTEVKQPIDEKISENIEQPKEEEEGQGKEPPIEPPTEQKGTEVTDSELTGITHTETDKVAKELGLPEYEKNPETVAEWDAEADKRIKKDPDSISKLLNKLKNNDQPDKIEQRMMAKYLASLKAKINSDPTNDKLINDYKNAKELSDKVGGREVGKSLVARKDLIPVEDSIGDLMVREMETLGVDKLTDKQKEDIVSDYNKIQEAQKETEAKLKILEEENAKLKAEAEFKKTTKSIPTQKKSKEDISKAREDIKQSIKDKWKKASNDGTLTAVPVPYAKQLAAIAPDVAKLVKSYVEEGVTELKEVVKKVLDDIKEYIPEITEKDVHDLIAGNYNEKKKTRNELSAKLKDLKDEAIYINKLEKLLNGEEPKGEKKKTERNRQIKELQDKIKDFKKSEVEANKFYGESETGNRKIEKMEDELQRLKDRKEKEPSTTVKKQLSEKEIELKQQIEEERKAFNKEKAEANKFYGEEIPSDIKALISYRKRLEAQANNIQDEINKGNYAPEPKKSVNILEDKELQKKYPKQYKEALEAKDKLIKLKQEREIKFLKQQYANRSKYDKTKDAALELINVPRALMSSFDFSAPLRQGIIPTVAHPKIALGAAKEMFANAFSQKRFDRYFHNLRETPEFKVMEKSGLYVADPHDHKLSAKEELFMNNLAEKIPVIGKIVAGSERAYVSYLNKMRVDIFSKGRDILEASGKTPENSPQDYKGLASWVNNSTGRGGMSEKMENASPILNSLFFSPRLIASRLNILGLSDVATGGKGFYSKLPKEIRKMVAGDLINFALMGAVVLALSKVNGADVETDPRSSDYGKIKVGDTRYDIWGGFQQYIRFITQMVTGKQKASTSGKITELNGKKAFGKTRADVATSFFRGKLAPIPSMAWDFMQGRTAVGQKTEIGNELLDHFTPLIRNDIQDAWNEQGAKAFFTIGLPATFGIGVQTYTGNKKPIIPPNNKYKTDNKPIKNK